MIPKFHGHLHPFFVNITKVKEAASLEWYGIDEDVNTATDIVTTTMEDKVELHALECYAIITLNHSYDS